MGFFSDLKEDLSQAVNEMLPGETKLSLNEMVANLDDSILVPDELKDDSEPKKTTDGSGEPGGDETAVLAETSNDAVREEPDKAAAWEPEGNGAGEDPLAKLAGQWLEEPSYAEPEPPKEREPESFRVPAEEPTYAEPEPPKEQEPESFRVPAEEPAYAEPEPPKEQEPESFRVSAEEPTYAEPEPPKERKPESFYVSVEEPAYAEPEPPEPVSLEEETADQSDEPKEQMEENKGAEKMMENNSGRVAVDETSVITEGMIITGDIVSEGSIDVIGTVNGNIDALGKLNITGHINGNSKAADIYAESAKINGEVISEGAVKIGASSVVIGNISATSAAIAGAVKGDIDVRGPVILDASAIVMGNIKSKSVQINNGAVIEGMCSQCYAEVSPTSFFDEYKPDVVVQKNKAK